MISPSGDIAFFPFDPSNLPKSWFRQTKPIERCDHKRMLDLPASNEAVDLAERYKSQANILMLVEMRLAGRADVRQQIRVADVIDERGIWEDKTQPLEGAVLRRLIARLFNEFAHDRIVRRFV